MPRKNDDSRQITIPYPRPSELKMIEEMDKLQTEISGIKDSLGRIHVKLQSLTIAVQSLQIAVDQLTKSNHSD